MNDIEGLACFLTYNDAYVRVYVVCKEWKESTVPYIHARHGRDGADGVVTSYFRDNTHTSHTTTENECSRLNRLHGEAQFGPSTSWGQTREPLWQGQQHGRADGGG